MIAASPLEKVESLLMRVTTVLFPLLFHPLVPLYSLYSLLFHPPLLPRLEVEFEATCAAELFLTVRFCLMLVVVAFTEEEERKKTSLHENRTRI